MLQRIISVYHRLAWIARQIARAPRRGARVPRWAALEVRPLEERATPAVGIIQSPIEPFLPAPMVELGLPRTPVDEPSDKLIIRIEFRAGTETPRPEADHEWEDWLASMDAPIDPLLQKVHKEEPEAPTAARAENPEDMLATAEDLAAVKAERAERLELQPA